MRHLTEPHQKRHGVVEPFDRAFRAANGQDKVVLLLPMPANEAVELRDFAPPERKIRHVEPRHQFVRVGNVPGRRLWLKDVAIALEHFISCIDKLAVEDGFTLVKRSAHRGLLDTRYRRG